MFSMKTDNQLRKQTLKVCVIREYSLNLSSLPMKHLTRLLGGKKTHKKRQCYEGHGTINVDFFSSWQFYSLSLSLPRMKRGILRRHIPRRGEERRGDNICLTLHCGPGQLQPLKHQGREGPSSAAVSGLRTSGSEDRLCPPRRVPF